MMGLEVKKQEYNGGNNSFLDGTFVGVATIQSAVSVSGTDVFNSGTPVDCGIKLTLDVGRDWYPDMTFYGNFKEKDGKLDWGSAFIVREFLTTMGLEGNLNEDGSIPEEMLNNLVGRKIIRLTYVRGYDTTKDKKQYSDYKFIAVVDDFDNQEQVAKAAKKLTDKFIRDVKANRVRNFNPTQPPF